MPYPVKGLLEVYEDMVEILLMPQVFLAANPEIEYLFCGASLRAVNLLHCSLACYIAFKRVALLSITLHYSLMCYMLSNAL